MNLKIKRKLEMDNQKGKRKEQVVLAAIEVFKQKGIVNSKMTDIATKAEIGVATVYRYFNTKSELVIAAATTLWEEKISILFNKFDEPTFMELNGADRVRTILNIFVSVYQKYPEFISFLEHFDNYIIKESIPLENLENYEIIIMDTKSAIFHAIDKGKKDGSIKSNMDNDAFYITITHSLMSLSQKLILRGNILRSDSDIKGDTQLKLLIDMAMLYLVY